jgi:hypothetical protein
MANNSACMIQDQSRLLRYLPAAVALRCPLGLAVADRSSHAPRFARAMHRVSRWSETSRRQAGTEQVQRVCSVLETSGVNRAARQTHTFPALGVRWLPEGMIGLNLTGRH